MRAARATYALLLLTGAALALLPAAYIGSGGRGINSVGQSDRIDLKPALCAPGCLTRAEESERPYVPPVMAPSWENRLLLLVLCALPKAPITHHANSVPHLRPPARAPPIS